MSLRTLRGDREATPHEATARRSLIANRRRGCFMTYHEMKYPTPEQLRFFDRPNPRTIIASRAWHRRAPPDSLAPAAFLVFVTPQFGFLGRSGGRVPIGRPRFGSSQNSGCGAARSDAVALPTLEASLTRRQTMQKGTVKWFNPTKGYGFIRPSTGDKDVFVHISAVERAGLSTLNEGQTVEFELVSNRGKTSAENIKVS
jgi:CspA family cold shock protein